MKMKKLSLALSLLVSLAAAQGPTLNSNGRIDTSMIVGFNGTRTAYSKAFNLSAWENLRFDVLAMDTGNSKTRFSGASIKFFWWISTGHYSINYLANKYDTVWSRLTPLIIDTFDITTAGNMAAVSRSLDTAGNYPLAHKLIDTLSVRGYAVQSRAIPLPEWDEIVRVGVTGLSGNQNTTYVKLIVAMHRRAANTVWSR
jgi:hypothetical protein